MNTNRLSIITLACAALSIAGCSDEPVPPSSGEDIPSSGQNYIEFNLYDIGWNGTRTGEVTTENIQQFSVSAYTLVNNIPVNVMKNVIVTRVGKNQWDYSPKVEWPDTGAVNFYAVSPCEKTTVDINHYWHTTLQNIDFRPCTDLVICAKMGVRKGSEAVPLNFVHTKARVHMKVSSDTPGEKVYMSAAEWFNMCAGAAFFFPNVTTDSPSSYDISTCWQHWNNNNFRRDTCYRGDVRTPMEITSKPVDVKNTDNEFEVPIQFTPLRYYGENNIVGTAIRLTVRFVDATTGEQTWPDADTPYWLLPNPGTRPPFGYIYLPLYSDTNCSFEAGKTYMYDIIIRAHGSTPPEFFADTTALQVPARNSIRLCR